MTIGQRKLLPDTETDKCPESCHLLCVDYYSEECAGNCCTKCPNSCDVPISPPPASSGKAISTHLLVVACVLGGFFLVSICCIVVWKYCSKLQESGRRRRRRRSRPPILGNNHEDFVDENHGPILDHPVWYIVTVGLPQSVIDSITVCKYRKGEGLIEGTECSICLGEFHEDESVRLLPKCSHAFHIPCIGTWLRSHKNCPLCRAPILSDGAPNELESREEEVVGEEIMGNYGEISSRRGREIDVLEETGELLVDFEAINGVSRKDLQNFEPGSDLVQNLLSVEQELEPVKRSVSLHSSSASLIYGDINALPVEGSSNIRMERMKRSNSKKEFRHGSGSTSLYRVMKSSSFRLPLKIRPISMKRSLSSNGSLIIQQQSRRQESVV